MATLNLADVYGTRSSAGAIASNPTVQVTGPNPASVTTPMQGNTVTNVNSTGAAMSWIGFAIALVLLRVALEMGGEVK